MVVNSHYAHIVKSTLKGHRSVIGKKGIDWLKSSAQYLSLKVLRNWSIIKLRERNHNY